VPIAVESLGPINCSGFNFISETGCHISIIYQLEKSHLFQRISICTQQFNAVAFRGHQILQNLEDLKISEGTKLGSSRIDFILWIVSKTLAKNIFTNNINNNNDNLCLIGN